MSVVTQTCGLSAWSCSLVSFAKAASSQRHMPVSGPPTSRAGTTSFLQTKAPRYKSAILRQSSIDREFYLSPTSPPRQPPLPCPSTVPCYVFCPRVGDDLTCVCFGYQRYAGHWAFLRPSNPAMPARIPNHLQYSGHSFRRGAACFAYEIGLDTPTIRALGDWRSSAYIGYIDIETATKIQAVNKILHHSSPAL